MADSNVLVLASTVAAGVFATAGLILAALLFAATRSRRRVAAQLKQASSGALVTRSVALTENTGLLLSCYSTREALGSLRRMNPITKKLATYQDLHKGFVELNQTANAISGALARCHSTLYDFADALGVQIQAEKNTIETINRLVGQGNQRSLFIPNIPTSAAGKLAFEVAQVKSRLREDLEKLAIGFNKQLDALYWLRDGNRFWQSKMLDFLKFPGTEAFPEPIDLASLAFDVVSTHNTVGRADA